MSLLRKMHWASYGLNIYNSDANGMNKIREYILDDKHYAKRVIVRVRNMREKGRLICYRFSVFKGLRTF